MRATSFFFFVTNAALALFTPLNTSSVLCAFSAGLCLGAVVFSD